MAWKSQEIKNEEKKIEPQTIKKSIVETKTEKTIALDDLSWLDKKG